MFLCSVSVPLAGERGRSKSTLVFAYVVPTDRGANDNFVSVVFAGRVTFSLSVARTLCAERFARIWIGVLRYAGGMMGALPLVSFSIALIT